MVHTSVFPARYRLGQQTVQIDTLAPQGKINGYNISVDGGSDQEARTVLTTLLKGLNQHTGPLDPPSSTGIFLRRVESEYDTSMVALNERMLQMGATDITRGEKKERWMGLEPVRSRARKTRTEPPALFNQSSWERK